MDVTVVGSCNIDLLSQVPRLPVIGETLHGYGFSMGFGGKGANQCIMATRMGAKCSMIAKVGDDMFGKNTVDNFKNNGINTDNITVTDEASSGVATIAVDKDGQNCIVIVSGANLFLSEKDLVRAEKSIKSSKVVVCQLEITSSTTLAALKMAKQHGVKTILNPAPAEHNLDPELFKYTDILCPNETEAELITGQKVETLEDAIIASKTLLALGSETVIVTLGAKGAVIAHQQYQSPVHVPTPKVNAVDTTGAGDAFVGALAYFVSQDKLELQESVRRACQIASLTVLTPGAQTSFPFKQQIPAELLL